MNFNLYDTVETVVDLQHARVRAGSVGYVVETYDDGSMDVEFDPDTDQNLMVISILPEQVRLAEHRQAA